jgi:hypothetical protein
VSTHRATWKRRERDAARFFGAERQPLSGSAGRPTGSDSTHDRLYIECKMRASSAVRTLWEQTRDRARKERKTPVLALFAKGKPGGLIVVHQDDLAAVAAELAAQSDAHVGITDPRLPGPSGPGALETTR